MTFDQGANNGNIITTVIDVLDDPLIEGTETFTISGSVDPPASFGTPWSTIEDDMVIEEMAVTRD